MCKTMYKIPVLMRVGLTVNAVVCSKVVLDADYCCKTTPYTFDSTQMTLEIGTR